MGNKYTEAQKKAIEKYQKTLKNISIRIKPDLYDEIKAAADKENCSLRDFVLTAINEKINRLD